MFSRGLLANKVLTFLFVNIFVNIFNLTTVKTFYKLSGMSKYIGWASNVNDDVLDESTYSIGQNGYVEDKSDSGSFTNRRLTSLASPDKINVVMMFNWSEKDDNGKSEFDRFIDWYKYEHQRGVNPFSFKSLSNFGVNGTTAFSYYKITGNLSVSKQSLYYKVSMEWTEVVDTAISIPDEEALVNYILADITDTQKIVYVAFTSVKKTVPIADDYTFVINEEEVNPVKITPCYTTTNMYKFYFDGSWEEGTSYAIVMTYTEGEEEKTQTFEFEV